MENKRLSAKQQAFIQEYLIDMNASQAAIRAGYSKNGSRVAGVRLLTNNNVAAAVRQGLENKRQRAKIDAESVLSELALIAFADFGTYIHIQPDGSAVLDWSDLPPGATRVMSEIQQEEILEKTEEGFRPVRKTRFKLHDKLGALRDLAKHLGLFEADRRQKMDVTLDIRQIVQRVVEMTPEDRQNRLEELERKRKEG